MLNEQTIEKLMDLHLRDMAKAFRTQMQDNTLKDMSFEDRFGLLVDAQWAQRKSNRIAILKKKAAFKFPHACMEDVDYSANRKLNRELLLELSQCKYIRDKRNILIMGAAGSGKTYLSMPRRCCLQLYSEIHPYAGTLVDMNIARGDGGYKNLMVSYKASSSILDEWMHQPISETQAGDVLKSSSQIQNPPPSLWRSRGRGWHRQIGNGVIADATLTESSATPKGSCWEAKSICVNAWASGSNLNLR